MIGKWAASWASFPPLHKKRFYQGLFCYILLLLCAGVWVYLHAAKTLKEWHDAIPKAEAPIRAMYITPQLTDVTSEGFNTDGNAAALTSDSVGYISLVMTGIGLAADSTERALEDLPPEIALGLSPYGEDVAAIVTTAGYTKREAFLMLPMEPSSYPKDDPGPLSLLSRRSEKENQKMLGDLLAAAPGITGVMNFMGSRFLADERNTLPVFDALQKKGITFVEIPGALNSVARESARKTSLSYLAADLLVDEKATEPAIRQRLLDLEKMAREKGYASGIVHPYPLTFNLVKSWTESLEGKGLRLVPVSAMTKIAAQKSAAAAEKPETPHEQNEQEQQP